MAIRSSELVTYGLLAAALATGAYLAVDWHKPTTSEQTKRAGMLLRVWRQDDVTRIAIHHAAAPRGGAADGPVAEQSIELLRDGAASENNWKMTQPMVTSRVELLGITALLNAIGGARSERAVGPAGSGDRAAFGLLQPRATVEIAMGGVTLKLILGGAANGGVSGADVKIGDAGVTPSAYLEIAPYGDEAGGVYVVPPEVERAIERDADSYRDPLLLGGLQSTVFSKIVIHAGDGGVTLERAEHGTWRIPAGTPNVSEAPVRADADIVNALFASFPDLKAQPFAPDTTPIHEERGGRIDIDTVTGKHAQLVFGGECPTAPGDARMTIGQLRAPMIITGCLPTMVTSRLARPGEQYVDGHLFGLLFGTDSAKTSEIESVTIERQGKKLLDAERRSDGLHLRAPTDQQADKEAADRLLLALAHLSGPIVSPPPTHDELSAIGLAVPGTTVTLKRRVDPLTLGSSAKAGTVDDWTQTLEVGPPSPALVRPHPGTPAPASTERFVYVRRVDDGAIVQLSAVDGGLLGDAAARALRSPNLVDVSSDAIDHVTVRGTGDILPWELSRTGALFTLQSPKGLGVDTEGAMMLTRALSSLTCVRWAADRDDGSFGFATPTATLTIHRATGAATADAGSALPVTTIELGGAAPDGGMFARASSDGPVCVLPDDKVAAATRIPADRSAVNLGEVTASKIVLRRDHKVRTLTRAGEASWVDADAHAASPGSLASNVSARKVADLLATLKAEAIVHLGAARPEDGVEAANEHAIVIEAYAAPGDTKTSRRIVIGAVGRAHDQQVYFARVDGLEATYAILRADVAALLELL